MDFLASDIIERIKSKLTAKELENLGFTPQVISNWKSRNSIPKADDLYKIAQFLGCTMEYLLTGNKIDDDYIFLSNQEQKLLNNFKKLSDKEKDSVQNICEALAGK